MAFQKQCSEPKSQGCSRFVKQFFCNPVIFSSNEPSLADEALLCSEQASYKGKQEMTSSMKCLRAD